ncbi:hypothetical protein AMTRI_Chr09g33280 [Amborella trichopoda]|nr:uncharacterized protein LOC18445378 isoform X1 [Amborella trichopoda]XP_020530060.1 uncharacterized protein LOC18445378 isoform X1 [Amborella trichopoda]|eukprot:XP_011627490.1 uncharacterized protein LOC18445378 isoform X1 [Amborella trichopoda]
MEEILEGNQDKAVIDEKEEEKQELTPWDQHFSVINLRRFDYNAPSALLESPHSGFLITCPIKREKSATKEAIAILEKFSGLFGEDDVERVAPNVANVAMNGIKKRKLSDTSEQLATEDLGSEDGSKSEGTLPSGSISSSDKTETIVKRSSILSLVKLNKSGLLLFAFPKNGSSLPDSILQKIFNSLESGDLSSPRWCHRILPIQETCMLSEKNMHAVVSKLVQRFLSNSQDQPERPLKFAVAFNRRGIEDKKLKGKKEVEKDKSELPVLDRDQCFRVVAGAVKDVAPDSVVDLKFPKMVVFVEVLPIPGIPSGSIVAAVSVLPHTLVNTKPRLIVKPLVSTTKTAEGKA